MIVLEFWWLNCGIYHNSNDWRSFNHIKLAHTQTKNTNCQVHRIIYVLHSQAKLLIYLHICAVSAENTHILAHLRGLASALAHTQYLDVIYIQAIYVMILLCCICQHWLLIEAFCISNLMCRPTNSKWVWSGNATVTNCRQNHCTARKSHTRSHETPGRQTK